MAVKIRLKRLGRRNRPFYRIVAIDSRTRRDGSEVERLGWYDPLKTDVAVDLNEDRIIHWLKKGAQPSETVNNILSSVGMQYKMHLIREGKSEEEIASALTEWQLRQEEIRLRKVEKKKVKKKAAVAKTQDAEETVEINDKAEVTAEEVKAGEESVAEDKPEEILNKDKADETSINKVGTASEVEDNKEESSEEEKESTEEGDKA